jgi:hypothetical protein
MRDVIRSLVFVVIVIPLAALSATAAPPPLVCSGGESSWSLALDSRVALLSVPGTPDLPLRGRYSSIEAKAHGWRGRPSGGTGGEVVAFVSETACRLGGGGEPQPFTVRVSLPDGRFLSGCCREGGETVAAAGPTPSPTPTPQPGATPAPSSGDWTSSLVTFLPAIKACLLERPQAEAVVFAAARSDKGVHLVLRLPEERYADCDLPPGRGPVKVKTRRKGATLADEEQAAVFTLLPSASPFEGCYRSQSALDEYGNPIGWISIKGC